MWRGAGVKCRLPFSSRILTAFARRLVTPGAEVLDVFSHVGGFGLAMLAAGARTALCVDGSAPALALQGEEDDGFDLRIVAVLLLPAGAASWALFNVWRVAARQGARIGEGVSGSSKIGLRAEE